ncbi:LysR family transcriptional regulator [Shewanella inventionis]|uniref:LysR family transcriptional regulator n=1 Tax=Shewanella inventionis TaxID=1738770 RepID=A0ABQ1JGD4_9GAMM|nr:LysR family transcriptional regulator [Shewanella inventionis]MCL1159547.1 LysR family transcriptional regulator [Shewanella inventionis]GGB67697.1 LysR family transcriptional regulator [Shewanella inventionis]
MNFQALKKVSELDVFSLLVFKIIYETGFANCAAKELAVSAPKISRCLTSLRVIFNDELFFRRQQGLKPTPLADRLYQPVCQLCDMVGQIERVAEDKSSHQQTSILHVAVSPSIITSVAIALSQCPRDTIGKVKLHSWQSDTEELIYNGELDFGIGFDTQDAHGLEVHTIGRVTSLCLVGKQQHSVWDNADEITLEDVIQHSIVYLKCRGFNNRIDPLELYCQTHGLPLEDIECVKKLEDWYWHILTLDSLALTICNEGSFASQIPQLRVERLAASEFARLNSVMPMPDYCLIERAEHYRRYSADVKQMIINITRSIIM